MLQVYRYFTYTIYPLLVILIYLRSIIKKEDKKRFKEKIFSSNFQVIRDDQKKLVWFHAASIGECVSIIPLIEAINNNNNNINFLVTTVTLSSSKMIELKLSKHENIFHRFFPLDTEKLAENFLNSWKPDLICFVDSEVWPNFLFKIKEKKIPLLLINARLTRKSFNRWKIINNFARKVFNNFDLCLAASEESKNNLSSLKAKNIKYIGNLKYSIPSTLDELNDSNKKILDNYKTWCAASTHNGEELIFLKTHIEIKKKFKNILTIIIPRHVGRSLGIKNLATKFNLNTQILNDNDLINSNVEILIINSFGVLSKYFNYCKSIVIGKSFLKEKKNIGGQNPIDAAKLGCKIFHGPYVYNFQEVYSLLKSYGIAEEANNEGELAEKIIKNIQYPNKINQKQLDLLNNYGEKILKETTAIVEMYLK
jgi:3-deoxy-D-manno-octulosonic-acid transferase